MPKEDVTIMPYHQESFPLAVSPIEHYFLAMDHEDYPMNLWVGLDLLGQADREIFPKAIQECLEGYPRFRALISGPLDKKTSDLSWIAAPTLTPYIYWGKEGEPLVFPKAYRIDLFSETGIRFFVQEGKLKTRIWIQVHHACCDGLGMIKLLEDLYRRYLSYLAGRNSPSHQLADVSRFQPADIPVEKRRLKKFWQVFRDIRRSLSFQFRPIQLLAVPSSPPPPCKNVIYPSFHSYTFDSIETQKIKHSAAQQSASLNDLLLRDLFLTLARWNDLYALKKTKRCFRIIVPVDLRSPGGVKLSAKNAVTMVHIDQSYKILSSPQKLLKKIKSETNRIKRTAPVDFTFSKFLNLVGRIKGGIYREFGGGQSFKTTTTLSIIPLDRLFSASDNASQESFIAVGEQLLEKILGLGPYKKKNPVSFSAVLFRGQLTVAVHFDSKTLSFSQSKELLDQYVSQIRTSLAPQAA